MTRNIVVQLAQPKIVGCRLLIADIMAVGRGGGETPLPLSVIIKGKALRHIWVLKDDVNENLSIRLRGNILRRFTSVHLTYPPGSLIYTPKFFQIGFNLAELFELKYDSPLHCAAGNQNTRCIWRRGSHVKNFSRLLRPFKGICMEKIKYGGTPVSNTNESHLWQISQVTISCLFSAVWYSAESNFKSK